MDTAKYLYLKEEFVPLLHKLTPTQKGNWGVLNAQQMVEHFSDAVKIASGKLVFPVLFEGEKLSKYREFLMSEIPFKENTKNAMMNEEPDPAKHASMDESIRDLQNELNYFFEINEQQKDKTSDNAFFGSLNFDQNIQLLHKHAKHHLKQFGIE